MKQEKEAADLVSAAKALIEYSDENYIYDRGGDEGGGYVDAWMSSELSELFERLEKAVRAVGGAEATPTGEGR